MNLSPKSWTIWPFRADRACFRAGFWPERCSLSPVERLPGWRRSADRTRLHANSLLTGNFSGKPGNLAAQRGDSRAEALHRSHFRGSSLIQLTGNISGATGYCPELTANFEGHSARFAGFAATVKNFGGPCGLTSPISGLRARPKAKRCIGRSNASRKNMSRTYKFANLRSS